MKKNELFFPFQLLKRAPAPSCPFGASYICWAGLTRINTLATARLGIARLYSISHATVWSKWNEIEMEIRRRRRKRIEAKTSSLQSNWHFGVMHNWVVPSSFYLKRNFFFFSILMFFFNMTPLSLHSPFFSDKITLTTRSDAGTWILTALVTSSATRRTARSSSRIPVTLEAAWSSPHQAKWEM